MEKRQEDKGEKQERARGGRGEDELHRDPRARSGGRDVD